MIAPKKESTGERTFRTPEQRKRCWQIGIFLSVVFVFLMGWMVIQPLNASPDESMRYQIIDYIVRHGTIPDGRDPEIRHELWGISYAFNPILAYMFMAIPAKLVSLFGGSAHAILLASRMVNVCFGTGMAYLVFRIGEMLFEGKERWTFTCLVTFLPGLLFVHSYVNNDSMALFSTAWIVYTWVRSMREGWSVKICIHLACAISMCGLSYYNAYGFVLCSILFFGSTILFCKDQEKRVSFLFRRGFLISAIVLLLIGWWFIRNGILYDGDILGWNISTEYAEKYAIEELKPSNRITPGSLNMGLWAMIIWVPGGWDHNWLITVAVSFIGTFGFMKIFMPYVLSKMYILCYFLGMADVMTAFRQTFSPRVSHMEITYEKQDTHTIICKKFYKQDSVIKKNVFHLCMLLAMVIPFILLLSYAYNNDFQAQGRYILPMVIPFMYFVTYGYKNLLERWVKKEKIRDIVYIVISILSFIGALYTYFAVFMPNYV